MNKCLCSRLHLAIFALLLSGAGLSSAANPTLQTFDDKATFLAATNAVNATGALPNIGLVAGSTTLGSVTFGLAPGGNNVYIGAAGTVAAPDWYPQTPGNDIALGYENLEVSLPAPVYALGFELVEPNTTMPFYGGAAVDSTYQVTLFNGSTQVGQLSFNAPDDVLAFVGVQSDTAFDRADIIDVTQDADGNPEPNIGDDEYFGQFYTSVTPATPINLVQNTSLGLPMPGGGGVFTVFPLDAVSAAGRTGFLGIGSLGGKGLYVCTAGNPCTPIAELTTAIPAGTGTFTDFSQLALNGLQAGFIGTGVGQVGVYTRIPTEPIRPVVNLTTAIPGGSGNFTGFSNLVIDNNRVGFIGTGVGQVGVYTRIPTDPPRPVANLSTAIPGGSGTFTGFSNLVIDNNRVGFIGTGVGQSGIYTVNNAIPSDPIRPVATLSTAIPGGIGTFTGFSALSASSGHLALLGQGLNNQKGIYLASILTKLIAVGDTLDGKIVSDLKLGRFALDGNTLSFTADFDDGSEGIYTADVKLLSYRFTGFFAPVVNPPVLNKVEAGYSIPVKFSLNGNQGLQIFNAGYPASQQIACTSGLPVNASVQSINASTVNVSYNAKTDRYSFDWKTTTSWKNTCRQLIIKLKDNSTYTANFKFTK